MDHELVACTRLYDSGQYYTESSIGRVVVSPRYRDRKLGHSLMKKSISEIENRFNTTTIRIGAQCYLTKFYQSHGFEVAGETYLEDGIEHVEMVRN
jgi:ElaA protein